MIDKIIAINFSLLTQTIHAIVKRHKNNIFGHKIVRAVQFAGGLSYGEGPAINVHHHRQWLLTFQLRK